MTTVKTVTTVTPVTKIARPPVIILGMHRSGTSLLARLLEKQGLFVGWKLAANHEASYFNKRNSWLLASAGGRWDTPAAFDHVLDDHAGLALATDYLRQGLSALPIVEFLGPRRYLSYRSLLAVREPWGWKDPRTTVTLPIWLALFPEARLVHMVRNGVDVAQSLTKRQGAGRELGRQNLERHPKLIQLLPKKGWFGTSPRAASRESAFQIWEEYLAYAERFTAGMGERLLELRYEELLASPQREMERLLDFCGLSPDPETLAASLSGIDADRAYSFRHDRELRELWQARRESPWMIRYGYDSVNV
ncbi:MAG: sulfotransferase [Acidobacteriota bacterium]